MNVDSSSVSLSKCELVLWLYTVLAKFVGGWGGQQSCSAVYLITRLLRDILQLSCCSRRAGHYCVSHFSDSSGGP